MGAFHIISFSLAAYNSDPRSYPDSSDFLEVSEDLPSREREPQGGSPRVREDPLGTPPPSLLYVRVDRVQHLGPPVPSTSQSEDFLGRERGGGA